MIHVITYDADTLAVTTFASQPDVEDFVASNQDKVNYIVSGEGSFDSMSGDLMLRLANHLCAGVREYIKLPPDPGPLLWDWLENPASAPVIGQEPDNSTPAKPPKRKRNPPKKKESNKNSNTDLQAGTEASTSPAPEAAVASDQPQEKKMAKGKKKASKKAVAKRVPKSEQGEPRKDSKKANMLTAVKRKSGATMAELLKITGWKACRGTLGEVVAKAGLKLRVEKGDGKVTRYFAE